MEECTVEYLVNEQKVDGDLQYGITAVCKQHGKQEIFDLTPHYSEACRLAEMLNNERADCIQLECICEDYLNLALYPDGGYF